MTDSVLIAIVVLLGIGVVTTTIFSRFRSNSCALGFGSAYALFMIVWWALMHNDTESEAHIWSLIIPLIMAAPASFLLPWVGGPAFAEKCVGLAILGGVQYGFLGFLIDLAVAAWKRKRNCQPAHGGDRLNAQ
jgi:hypothetical protein